MVAQPSIPGGTITPEGADTAGAAPDVVPYSVSSVPSTTAAARWWKITAAEGAVLNFDAMLSYTADGVRTNVTPHITVSVFHSSDLVIPIASAGSGVDPQQGSVARGSVSVSVDLGSTYYISLTGGPDSYRFLRVSAYGVVSDWLTIPDAEFIQVIAPDDKTIEPVNFSGSYNSVVARSSKTLTYGLAPAFFGPPAYFFGAAWICAWIGHLVPCYKAVDGQVWNNAVTASEWTGSGICKVTPPPGPTSTSVDFLGPGIAWSNVTDDSGHATGSHTATGYRIFNEVLLADDPGPTGLGDLPPAPPGAVLQWEDDDPSSVLTLEIAATDDGTGEGEAAFRRFNGGLGVDADGDWWVGEKPDGDLIITGYDGSVSWQPFFLEEVDTTKVVGYTQYVEDSETPLAPSTGPAFLGESMEPDLAFRLTWDPRRYRWVYPPVVPPVAGTGIPPRRIFQRSDGATRGAARIGNGNTRQSGSRTLGAIL